MKLRLLSLLLLGALLAGCTPQTSQPGVTTSPTAPEEKVPNALLNNVQPVGQAAGLLYVPNGHVESMAVPQMQLFGKVYRTKHYLNMILFMA